MPIVVKIPPFSTYNKKVFKEMEVAMGKTRVIFLFTVFTVFSSWTCTRSPCQLRKYGKSNKLDGWCFTLIGLLVF